MKKTFLISLQVLIICHTGVSQAYLDSSFNKVDRSKAVYYQTFEDRKDGHFIQKTFMMNNTLVKLETLIITNGEKSYDGTLLVYYPNGQLHYSRDYSKNVLNGEVKGYYENGIVRRLEHYQKGEMTDGKCYDTRGQDTTFFEYESQATFKGRDIAGFREYVQKKVKYPPESAEAGNYGRIVVHFSVSPEGKIEDVQIKKSPDEYLAKEVFITVSNAGNWKPATLEGKNVRQDFVIPVIFML